MDRVAQITLEIRKLQVEQNAELLKLRANSEWYYQVGYFLYDYRMMFLYTAITITVLAGSFYMGYYYGANNSSFDLKCAHLNSLIDIQTSNILELKREWLSMDSSILYLKQEQQYTLKVILKKNVDILHQANALIKEDKILTTKLWEVLVEIFQLNLTLQTKQLDVFNSGISISESIMLNNEAIEIITRILNSGN